MVLNYIEHLFILFFTITGFDSISPFTPLIGIHIGIVSTAIGLKVCGIT